MGYTFKGAVLSQNIGKIFLSDITGFLFSASKSRIFFLNIIVMIFYPHIYLAICIFLNRLNTRYISDTIHTVVRGGPSMDICQSRFLTLREEGIANILESAGFKRCFAMVLVCFIREPCLTSWDIERGTGLRQPEVSVAINYLIGRRWAEVAEINPGNNGRLVRLYRLGTSFDRIIDDIEKEKREDFSVKLDVIDQLRTALHDSGQG